jgi:hypothetical protein
MEAEKQQKSEVEVIEMIIEGLSEYGNMTNSAALAAAYVVNKPTGAQYGLNKQILVAQLNAATRTIEELIKELVPGK